MEFSRCILVLAVILSAAPSYAARFDNLLAVYNALDQMCRGWPGDDPHISEVCDARNKASDALKDAGLCFKGMGADSHWAKCK